MTKQTNNLTDKLAIMLIAVLSLFMEPISVKAGSLRDSGEEIGVSHRSSLSVPNLFSGIIFSGRNTINDDTNGILCPENISTYTDLNSCDALITSGLNLKDPDRLLNSLTWTMEGATTAQSPSSGVHQLSSYVFEEGTTTVTYRGRTRNDEPVFCSFEVIVSDNQSPRLKNSLANITVEADDNSCSAIVNWQHPEFVDNCVPSSQIIWTCDYEPGSDFPVGVTRVNYELSDGMEMNTASYSFEIIVVDNQLPEFTSPARASVRFGSAVPEAYTNYTDFKRDGGSASDNCGINFGSFSFEKEIRTGLKSPFTITRTYKIEDINGNIAKVDHHIVVDNNAIVLKSGAAEFVAVQNGNWNDPATWGGSTVPSSGDNVTIPSPFVVTMNASGVCDDITIESGGSLIINGSYNLDVNGDWSNNGTFTPGSDGTVTFTGTSNATVSGTTTFENLVVAKGSLSTVLTITGTVSVSSGGALTMTSGLVEIGTGGSLDLNYSSALTIPSIAGFDVTGGTLTTGNFSITNNGLIRVSSGIANFGNSSGNTVHTQIDGAFIVSSGIVNIAGRLENTAGGNLTPPGVNSGISISGGTVTLATAGNGLSSTGSLNVTANGDFSFTGGTIVFQNPSTASTELDLGIIGGAGSKNASGGTFQFGNSSTPPGSVFVIDTEIPLGNLSSSSNADLLLNSDLTVTGSLSLDSNTNISLNGFSLDRSVSATGTYSFPIADGTGNPVPVDVTISSGSFGGSATISVSTTDVKHPDNESDFNYLNQYWTIQLTDISNPVYSVSAIYQVNDISGTESEIAGGAWTSGLPWQKGVVASSGPNTITVSGLTDALADITGITLDAPTITIDEGSSATICDGDNLDIHTTVTGDLPYTYSWTSTPAGYNTTTADISVSPSVNTTYTVIFTDGNGFTSTDNIVVNVNPVPNVTPAPGSETLCSGSATNISLSGNVTGTTYSWTVSQSGVTGAAAGSGNTINQTLNTTGAVHGTATYTITPAANGCSGPPIIVIITVNPIPSVSSISDQTVCNNTGTTTVTFSGTATSYNWINDNTSIGLAASGTGDITSFITTNAGNSPEVANITVTPVYSNNGVDCTGASESFTITVNPIPTVNPVTDQELCAGDNTSAITFSGTATSFEWTNNQPSIGLAASGTGNINSFTATNTGTAPVIATVEVTPVYSNNGVDCYGTPETFSITVNPVIHPAVQITISGSATICEGEGKSFTSNVTGTGAYTTYYQWQINGIDIPGETGTTLTYSNFNNGDIVKLIVDTDAPCNLPGESFGYTMTVNPTVIPSVTILESSDNMCEGDLLQIAATITNPGSAPGYQWQSYNGTIWSDILGATSQTYSNGTLTNGQYTYRVHITSNANCASPTDTVSSSVTIDVNPVLVPDVTISADQTTICPGETIHFTADTLNAGYNPSYQWKVNGIAVGTDLPTYSSASLNDGSVVSVEMTSDVSCPSPLMVSDNVTITVNPGNPAIPGAISGNNAVCPGESVTYTIASVTDATRYNWTIPAGWSGLGVNDTTTSITVTAGSAGTSGSITVTAENSCGTSSPRTIPVSVGTLSTQPSVAVSNNNECATTSKVLSITSGTLGTGAQWVWYTDACGGTQIGTGSSLTVSPAAGTSTWYYARAEGDCDTTDCDSVEVIVSSATPTQPVVIFGNTPHCPGTSDTFFINSIEDATSYAWSVPGGWTITTGQGDTMIVVTVGNYGQNGNVRVTASNYCGTSTAQTLAVTVSPGTPSTPGNINGESDICAATAATYSISAVTNASTYNWSVPSGWTINSGQGTTSISVTNNGTSGTISVTAENSCGESAASTLPVNVVASEPSEPTNLDGLTGICPTLSTYYTIDAVSGADYYTWVVPDGWQIDDGQGTTTLSVTITSFAESGDVKVVAENACGSSDTTYLEVTIDNTGTVYAGDDIYICEGTTVVTMQAQIGGVVDGANDWNWVYSQGSMSNESSLYSLYTLPTGFTTGTIYIAIEGDNRKIGCGGYIIDTMKIVVLPDPTARILSTDTVCYGGSGIVTIEADPNTTITYRIALDLPQTADVDETGILDITVPNLTANTNFRLMSVKYTDHSICQTTPDTTVVIVVNNLVEVDAGSDQTLCSSSPEVTLAGSVTGGITSGIWSGGLGSFSDASDLSAIYTPHANDISAGSVTLILTSDDPSGPCGTDYDEVTIYWNQAATVNAGPNQEICSSGTVALSGSFGGSASTATWTGAGSFSPNATAMNAIYTPSAGEASADSFRLVLTSNDPLGVCGAATDTLWVKTYPAATVNAGNDTTICASSGITLNGLLGGGASTAVWSGGNGTFDPDNLTLTARYTPSADEIFDGTVTLTLTTDDPANPCGAVSDQITITLDEAPTVDAGIDENVCEGSDIILNGTIGGSATTSTWSEISGWGSFSDVNALNPDFTPESAITGLYTLVLTTNNPSNTCLAVADTMLLMVDTSIGVTVGNDTMICSDATIELNGWVESGLGTWSTSGSGSFNDIHSPNAVYQPSNGDIFNENVTLTFTTEIPSGDCGAASATMELSIKQVISITTQPVNTGVCATDVAELFVQAVGDNLTYQWYHADGSLVSNSSTVNGAQTATLQFTNATSENSDGYYVIIDSPNACGSAISDTVTLNVDEEISVTNILNSDSVCVGENIYFWIEAIPGGSLAYQWRKNGVDLVNVGNISGVNNDTLSISNISLADAGSYSVYLTGLAGYTCDDAQSVPGNLIVIEDAAISPSDTNTTFCLDAPIDTIEYTVNNGVTAVSVTSGSLPANLNGTFDLPGKRFIIYGTPVTAGSYTFTLTASGFCTTATATGTITINNELSAPVLSANQNICYNTTPAALMVLTEATGGSGPYLYQWQDSTAGGNWASISGATGSSYNPPALTVATYYRVIAYDTGFPACDSVLSAEVTIIPEDIEPPVFNPPATFTLTADASCGGNTSPTVTGRPVSTSYADNCAPDTFLINHTTYYDHDTTTALCGSGYSYTRTWVVIDEAGNFSEEDQTINVEDRTAPVLTAPVGFPITCDQDTTPAALGQATAVDNCDPNPSVTYYDVINSGFCDGEYTIVRHWVAADACGNADTLIRSYSVSDNTPPVILSSGDTVVQCVVDIPDADPSSIGFYDACGNATIELIDEIAYDLDNESGYCPYIIVRTWEVMDDCFNRDTVLQTISVEQDASCAACSECLYDNTLYIADFRNQPYEDTTFYDVVKRDKCCGAENEPGAQNLFCASFKVRLDDGAVGVEILIDHVTPPGQDWQLDCEVIDGGSVVCLPSGEFHLFTFCKHAQSEQPQNNDYTFRQVRGVIASGDIETREECDEVLSVTGEFSNPVWQSIYPGNPGDYDHLLSSTTDTIVYFNAEPGSPPHIQYQVCGEISATLCATTTGGLLCDTADVYVRPAIEMELDINPDLICEDFIPTVSPILSPAGVYDLEWYIGATPSGLPVSYDDSYTPPSTGWYSVVAIDNATGLDCNRDTFSFEMRYDLTGPTIKDAPPPLLLECNSSDYAQQINDWLNIPTAEYINEWGDTVPTPVSNDYYTISGPVEMICGDTVMVTFSAMDQCSNDTLAYGYIYVADTTDPVITPAHDTVVDCNTQDYDSNPGYQAWLASHGGATASDQCDPDLDWSDNSASMSWVGNGARDSITVTFSVTDDCGNVVSTTATFTFIDDQPPLLSCPASVTEDALPGNCSKVPTTLDDPVYSDLCSNPVLSYIMTGATTGSDTGRVTNLTFNVGITYISYYVTDDAGNIDSCSFTVTIVDVTPPNIEITNCRDVTGTMDANDCEAIPPILDNPLYEDDCWPVDSLILSFEITGAWDTTGFGYVSSFMFPVGVSTVTYTVTDPDGNQATCSFNVTMLQDDIPWTAYNCPPDYVSYTLGATECEIALTLPPPTFNDHCRTATYTVTNDFNGDSVINNEIFPVGITEVIWTITDNSGNDTTCVVTVEIDGIQLPTISCPSNVSGTMDITDCFAQLPNIDTADYSAPCWPRDSLELSFHIINGIWDTTGLGSVSDLYFPVGENTVWYIVTDPDGNQDSCFFTVTILQDAPQWIGLNCPSDPAPYTLGANECEATFTLTPPTVIDECLTSTYVITNEFNGDSIIENEIFPVGSTEVIWHITNNSGWDTTCIVHVVVTGVQYPDVTCPPSVSGTMDITDCFAQLPNIDTADYSSPCWPRDSLELSFHIINGIWDTTGLGSVSDLFFPVGVNTVWYIISDPDGLKDSCFFTVTILQDAPQWIGLNCPSDPAPYTLGANECEATMTLTPPTVNDECLTSTYVITNEFNGDSIIENEIFPVGSTEVIWHITNNSGWDTTCIVHVVVTGVQYPDVTCPPSVSGTLDDATDCYAQLPNIDTADYSSPCWPRDSLELSFHIINGIWDTTGLGSVSDLFFPVGVNTVWYIISDPDGLKDSCSFTVTILQDAIPSTVYTCPDSPANQTVDSTSCDIWVDLDSPVINDHCVTATYSIDNDSPYRTDSADASGYYPIGQHTITWTISDNSGNDTTCVQTFEVFDLLPVLQCPPSITVFADENELFATGITVGLPRYQDNCDSTLIYTVMPPDSITTVYDSDPSGINLLTGPHTYNLGVTTIWYNFRRWQ